MAGTFVNVLPCVTYAHASVPAGCCTAIDLRAYPTAVVAMKTSRLNYERSARKGAGNGTGEGGDTDSRICPCCTFEDMRDAQIGIFVTYRCIFRNKFSKHAYQYTQVLAYSCFAVA